MDETSTSIYPFWYQIPITAPIFSITKFPIPRDEMRNLFFNSTDVWFLNNDDKKNNQFKYIIVNWCCIIEQSNSGSISNQC